MTDAPRPSWRAFCVGFLDHPALAGKYDRRSALHWLIENAAWKDHQIRTRAGMITLKRGQVLVARDHLAKAWDWTTKKVRLFLEQMMAADILEIGPREGQYANVATICNYDRYQFQPNDGGPTRGPTKGQPKASDGANEGPHNTRDTTDTRKDPPTPKEADRSASEVNQAFDAYNQAAVKLGLATAAKLTADRKRKIAARLADYGLDGWNRALANIERSAFLTGKTSHGFRASLDFVCQPTSFGKLHDGGYSGGSVAHAAPDRFVRDDDGNVVGLRNHG
jgi:hypothetical protein